MGKMNELNTVMWVLFGFMTMFYLGPGTDPGSNTIDWIFGLIGLN